MISNKKVLVISPLDPKNPTQLKFLLGGESTFTKMLLENHLPHFKYYFYEDAIRQKIISYHPLTWFLLYLQKFKILPPGPRVLVFNLYEHFDLIYVHAYPIKIVNKKIPLIISDSSSNIVFLQKYLELPSWQIYFYIKFRNIIFKIFNITDSESNPKLADKIIVFSKWAKKIKQSLSVKNCLVLYPGLKVPKTKNRKNKKIIKILFVGVWFERKGGRILLEVFRKLAKKYLNISLTILGPIPNDIQITKNERIIQNDFVSYKELKKHYQTHDILVHVPPKIEGYGMAVVEGMSYGLAIIVSSICALPEFIENGKSGLIITPNSKKALENALEKIITNSKLREKFQITAKKRFQQNFSLPVFQKKLGKVFDDVL